MIVTQMQVPAKETQVNYTIDKLSYTICITGGPLMTKGRSGNRNIYELIGVVSEGLGNCTSIKFPGVYTRVTSMNNWIFQTTKEDWNSCERVE